MTDDFVNYGLTLLHTPMSESEKQRVMREKDTRVDVRQVLHKRRWHPFKIVAYKEGEGDYPERYESQAYIDVNEVEAFYEVFDELRSEKSVIMELETGSTFRVLNTLEEVYAIING